MKHCDICPFLKDSPAFLWETRYWKVNLAQDQAYLGRCYIVLKRHCGDLAKLTSNEWKEFLTIIKKLESALKKAFQATMFNWTCLMNDAYQKSPPNPHVHWHFRPRYNRKVVYANMTFKDPEFGHHYAREHERSLLVSDKILQEIIQTIKKFI